MGKRDFLKLQGHAQQLGLGINNLLHTNFGQKENINRWNNFGLENRYSFDSAILDRIPSFKKKVFILQHSSNISILKHHTRDFNFPVFARPGSGRARTQAAALLGLLSRAWNSSLTASPATANLSKPRHQLPASSAEPAHLLPFPARNPSPWVPSAM